MTDIIEENSSTEYIQFEDLDCFWMNNGLPVFMANRDNICDIVESMGFSIYYVLTNNIKTTSSSSTHPTTKVVTTTTNTAKNMQLYKVVNNFVGRCVTLSNDPFDDSFIKLEEEAVYNMPAIPHVMIDKLDQFFRLVDAQHGTESIVMLTYDTTKEGSDGWGILVPDQTNTSVHCNYDPNSIAEVKPDNVMIVGSVHSHPGMAAYASGTDHKDQADFDGIHITFGWQKSVNNGATQYHIELQMAGKAYTLRPEDVFEDYTLQKEPDPEVVEWTDKVKKVLPPNMGGYSDHTPRPPHQTGGTDTLGTTKHYTPTTEDKKSGINDIRKRFHEINNFAIESNAIVVAEIEDYNDGVEKKSFCPSCGTVLDAFNFVNFYCDFCFIPVAEKNTPINTIIENVIRYCSDLYLDTDCPLYLWTINDDGTQSLIKIVDGTISEVIKNLVKEEMSPLDRSTYVDNIDGVDMDTLWDFDEKHRSFNFYSSTGDCSSCQHYYEPQCPRFVSLYHIWEDDRDIDMKTFEGSINDEDCPSYELYSTYNSNSQSVYYGE